MKKTFENLFSDLNADEKHVVYRVLCALYDDSVHDQVVEHLKNCPVETVAAASRFLDSIRA